MRFAFASALIVLVVAAVAVPASGFWTLEGAFGTSSADVGAPSALIAAPATTTQPLYPTGTALGAVSLTLTNPNDIPVFVPQLALDVTQGTGGFAVDAAHAGCDLAALAFATQTNGGAGWSVPASGSLPLDLTNSITLATWAPDACQGASFTVYLTSA